MYVHNAGILTDPLAPSTFGSWLNHAGTQHIGALSFLISDFFLFFGVAVLTVLQASQVFMSAIFLVIHLIRLIIKSLDALLHFFTFLTCA